MKASQKYKQTSVRTRECSAGSHLITHWFFNLFKYENKC